MILISDTFLKEKVLEAYPAESVLLVSRNSTVRVDDKKVDYLRTDALSVLRNKNDHEFLVQFLSGSHKGEIYKLKYSKTLNNDGFIKMYAISQEKLMTSIDKLPQELQDLVTKTPDTNEPCLVMQTLTKYINRVNNDSLQNRLMQIENNLKSKIKQN